MSTAPAPSRLSEADLQHYHADGFLIVRGVYSPEDVQALDAEAQRLFSRADLIDSDNIRCRWQNDVDTGECRFDCFDPVIDLSPVVERVARDRRLFAIGSALYGEQACLFKDKLIFKPPKAQGYGLHQDYIAWPTFPKSFLTVMIAIDPCSAGNGATEVFPGYHRGGCLTAEDGQYHQLPEDAVDTSRGVVLDLEPGDIAVFSGYTPHRSAPNRSDQWRQLLYLSYNAMSDGGEQRTRHYAEFGDWLKDRYAEYGKTSTFFR